MARWRPPTSRHCRRCGSAAPTVPRRSALRSRRSSAVRWCRRTGSARRRPSSRSRTATPRPRRAAGLPHLDVRILEGEVVAPRDDGPWAGVYRLMLGHWEKPEATEEALRGGLLHTGDLGDLDDGLLFVRDRQSQLISAAAPTCRPRSSAWCTRSTGWWRALRRDPDERLGEARRRRGRASRPAPVTAEQLTAHRLRNSPSTRCRSAGCSSTRSSATP